MMLKQAATVAISEKQLSAPVSKTARANETKLLLITAAEQLFAEYGIDAVSLREIAIAAGQANNNAIQYHFGTKADLVYAILDDRFTKIESRRKELLEQLTASNRTNDVRELLRALFLPRAELVDTEDRNIFAKFMMEFRIRFKNFEGISHPIDRAAGNTATRKTTRLLKAVVSDLSPEIYAFRTRYLSNMFDSILVERDTMLAAGSKAPSRQLIIERALDIAVPGLLGMQY